MNAPPPKKPRTARSARTGTATGPERPVYLLLLLVALTVAAYLPALKAGFIWDDDAHVTANSTLRNLHGLERIWFDRGAVPQYYPLVHTTFWIEYHLWGLHPLGFHLDNVLLQALAAILLWRLLRRLGLRSAWFAAALFAVHPVTVESVAWVTERKNVLSLVFYLASALAYLRFDPLAAPEKPPASSVRSPAKSAAPTANPGPPRTASAGLPPKRWRWYAASLLLFACSLWSKTVTCSLPVAILLAIWWKRGRLRREEIFSTVPFFVLGAALGLQTAWLEHGQVGARGAGFDLTVLERCLLAARAYWFYAGKLIWPSPLTFIYPRWTVSTGVWWQWLFPPAALGLLAALWMGRRRIGRGPLFVALLYAVTLFPALGFVNIYFTRFSYVADHFQYLASLGPLVLVAAGITDGLARLNWQRRQVWMGAGILLVLGGLTWRQCGMYADEETLWRATLSRNADSFIGHCNLGNALVQQGTLDEAISHFRRAIELKPDYEVSYYDYGTALMQKGEVDPAITQFQKAVEIWPGYEHAYNNLAGLYVKKGEVRSAIGAYETAMRLRSDSPVTCNNLAWLRATCPLDSLRNGSEAVQLAERADRLSGGTEPMFVTTLAAAYAECGRFSEAAAAGQRALELAQEQQNARLVAVLRGQIALYQARTPFRDRIRRP